MRRISEKLLLNWYQKKRRKPLVLRGARQVGKSTLVRQFCENQNLPLFEINLETQKLFEFERDGGFDVQRALQEIELFVGRSLCEKSVIFIDEIQEQPEAISKLRYFFEKRPELCVITAGSLLEVAMREHAINVPVGRVEYHYLGPMTFKEFLWAKGEEKLVTLLESLDLTKPVFSKCVKYLQEYYFVGGMPESVYTFTESQSLLEVRSVQRSLMQSYQDDLIKYVKNQTLAGEVIDFIPSGLGEKVKYTNISDKKSRDVKEAIEALSLAGLIYKVHHSNCSKLPVRAGRVDNIFKLYFLDIGLLNYLSGLDWQQLVSLSNKELLMAGKMAEQFVVQHLLFREEGLEKPEIFYWLRDKNPQKGEIDFILQENQKILPVEVKANKRGHLKSLNAFIKEKNISRALRLDLEFREDIYDEELCNLPLFAVQFFRQALRRTAATSSQ